MDWLIIITLSTVYFLGGVATLHAILYTRTPQGMLAWSIALLTLPFISLPFYLVFGKRKFRGYLKARQKGTHAIHALAQQVQNHYKNYLAPETKTCSAFTALAELPFTCGNQLTLLIDGQQTYEALFSAIQQAKKYLLVQYYIIREDTIGRKLQLALLERAQAGVKIYLLYDSFGSSELSNHYLEKFNHQNIEINAFNETLSKRHRLQINFRNHRKLVIIDGEQCFLGGINIGEEYLTGGKNFTAWRDTHIACTGPACLNAQLAFVEDWLCDTGELLNLEWNTPTSTSQDSALILPMGPADELETGALYFLEMIHSAQQRIWITSPYFTPDTQIISALQLAALRGVEVRIIIPKHTDQPVTHWSSFRYIEEVLKVGVQIYHYLPGFCHQKVVLVDQHLCGVGTANLDNRSLRLNFEIELISTSPTLCDTIEQMLTNDFSHSERLTLDAFKAMPLTKKLLINLARFLAPVQ